MRTWWPRAMIGGTIVGIASSIATGRSVEFVATGYAIAGRTASGTRARPGIVAADPSILPIGTRIRVSRAGSASGDYRVEDTGPGVRGRHIDIFFESEAAARRFGRRHVGVEVLSEHPRLR